MSTAEPTRDAETARARDRDERADDDRAGRSESPSAPPPESAALEHGWLLRAASIAAVLAAALGVLVAPGVRGNASESVVVGVERAASALSYVFYGLLLVLLVRGVYEIVRARRLNRFGRAVIVLGTAVCAMMAAPAFRGPLPPFAKIALAAGAIVAVVPAAYNALRAPHTRAVGFVLWLFAIASIARLGAWECGELASRPEQPLLRLIGARDVLAIVGVVFEGLGQLVAAAWLGTRSRVIGHLSSSLAIAGAFVLTWGAAQGIHAHAWAWQAVMQTALADAAALSAPLGAVAAFLVCASILLALAAVLQPRQVIAVTSALAMGLISRGAFDAPLRALAAVAGAIWIAVAMNDERTMWKALVDGDPSVRAQAKARAEAQARLAARAATRETGEGRASDPPPPAGRPDAP